MKKLVAISIMAAMLLAIGAVAMASETDWMLLFKGSTVNNQLASNPAQCGTATGATDNYETTKDGGITILGGNAAVAIVRSDWTASNPPIYGKDARSPMGITDIKTWDLVFWLGTAYNATDAKLFWWNATTATQDMPTTIGGLPTKYIVEVVSDPTGVNTGKKFELDGSANGSSTAPLGTLTWTGQSVVDSLKMANADAVNNGVKIRFTAMVPEPSSIFALVSGLAGMAGFAIRRRK